MNKYKVDDKVKYKSKNDDNGYSDDTDFECLCNKTCVTIFFILVISIVGYLIYLESAEERLCLGEKCRLKACNAMKSKLCSGPLCMDLCVYRTIDLDACMSTTEEQTSKLRLFTINEPTESTIVCSSHDIDKSIENLEKYYEKPEENINLADFEKMIVDLIASKLNYEPHILNMVDYLLDFADVNRDEKLNLAEAKTIWTLLNNKHTFYMLIMNDRHYIPLITRACGDLIEIEQVTSAYLYSIKDDSILPSLFPNSYKWSWPKWEYRVKLVLSVLEFYTDSESFNPNDEFGKSSLYLCSPIESSFGYTYAYEAKLLNYENLLTAGELEEKLGARRCSYDTDCIYTSNCIARCNQRTNRCSSHLAEPQIVNLCRFIKVYLLDGTQDTNITNLDKKFEPILRRCFRLANVSTADSIFSSMFSKTFSHEEKEYVAAAAADVDTVSNTNRHLNSQYALEYSLMINDLKAFLWSFIKYSKDPPKPKKARTATTTATTVQQHPGGDGGKN